MRAVERYRGVIIVTNLGGGFYFQAKTGMVCRVNLAEVKREIDRLFV
jgi:hypothetical protein